MVGQEEASCADEGERGWVGQDKTDRADQGEFDASEDALGMVGRLNGERVTEPTSTRVTEPHEDEGG